MNIKLTLGERLKDLRVERNLKLEALAEQTGLSKSALSKYESDDVTDLSIYAVTTLAEFYGVTTDYLLGVTENKKRPDAVLSDLHLSDGAVDVLRNGKFNHRLLCELIVHENFQRFMTDLEIYVDGYVSANIQNLNAGLEATRQMLNDPHLIRLTDFVNSKDCFSTVDIAGGICYFLWDRDKEEVCEVTNVSGLERHTMRRNLNEFGEIFIRSNESLSIIHKVLSRSEHFLTDRVQPIDAFGFPSAARGEKEPFDGCVSLIHSQGTGYIKRSDVKKNAELIDKYKATISILVPCNGEVGIDPSKGYKAITTPRIEVPGEVNTFSYLVLGAFDTEAEIKNYKQYLMCKFTRFMLRLTYSSMHIARANFVFVPDQDFTEEWTDEKLYKKYELTEDEIAFIESTIRVME